MAYSIQVKNEITGLYEVHTVVGAGAIMQHSTNVSPDNWVRIETEADLDSICHIEKSVTFMYRIAAARDFLLSMGFYDLIDISTFPLNTPIYTLSNGNYFKLRQGSYGVIYGEWYDVNGTPISDTYGWTSGDPSIEAFFPYNTVNTSYALDMAYGYTHSWIRIGFSYERNYWYIGRGRPDSYPSTPPYVYYVPRLDAMGSSKWSDCQAFWNGVEPFVRPDPYDEITPSGPGGGNQPYNPYETDDIGFNLLPEVSAVGTGFISLWSPTEQQMLDLSGYMWNANPLTLDFWRKLVADPLQLIYGLNIIPLDLQSYNIVGATPEDVVVGMRSTGIKMNYLTQQWVEVDCGSIDIDESMLGSYMDYDPFTKMEVYLPYIGYRPLKVDDFMPGTMSIKYKIDLLTGACVAQIQSTKSDIHDDELNSIIYQFMGNCATQVPVTASQYADAVRSAITTAAAIGTVAMLAGTGAGAAAATGGASLMPGADPVGLLNSPGMVPVESDLYNSMYRYTAMTMKDEASSVVTGAAHTLKNIGGIHYGASAASNAMGIKPSVERSGAIGGAAGMLSIQKPYVIFTRPRIAHPENQNTYMGYPSFMTRKLSELSGFTQIQEIHLEGLACTANELAEINSLLKSGVIF